MYTRSCVNITVKNSSFDNNKAEYYDGGVLCLYFSIRITVDNSSFINNVAGNNGGVISAGAFNESTSCIFIIFGFCLVTQSKVTFQNNCTFVNNSAYEGGVVYVRDARFVDLGSMYYANMASNGGAITLNEGFVKAAESKFMNNTARNSGGVLYTPLHLSTHVIKLEKNYFVNNSAISGGAIAVFSNDVVTYNDRKYFHS